MVILPIISDKIFTKHYAEENIENIKKAYEQFKGIYEGAIKWINVDIDEEIKREELKNENEKKYPDLLVIDFNNNLNNEHKNK